MATRPEVLRIHPAQDSPTVEEVQVIQHRKGRLRILSATASDPRLSVTVEAPKGAENPAVRVTIPGGYQVPGMDVAVLIKTDDPEFPEISVPVRATEGKRSGKGKFGPRPPRPVKE